MARRSPARLLAPLSLIAVVVALFLVVTSTLGGGGDAAEGTTTTQADTAPAAKTTTTKTPRKRKRPKTYTVQPGDILSTVSERTGVSVAELQTLNPDVDPQALQVGQELKLTAGAGTTTTP